MYDFLLNVLAGIVGIVIILFIDRSRRPELQIKEGNIGFMEPDDQLGRPEAAFRYIKIKNKPIFPLWGFFFDREPAYACKAWITFMDLEKNRLFEEEMLGRWTSNPEPLIHEIKKGDKVYRRLQVIQNDVDIHPGEELNLNTVVKIKGDKNCYGWSDETYLHGWENPKWKISEKKFLMKIRIRTGGREYVKIIGIENNQNFKEIMFFRL